MVLTMMFCPDMNVEQHLCAALGEPLVLEFEGHRLLARGTSLGFEAVLDSQT